MEMTVVQVIMGALVMTLKILAGLLELSRQLVKTATIPKSVLEH